MEHKTFPAIATKIVDVDQGICEHIIAVHGVLDLGKDISHLGSFSKTLHERGEKTLVLDMHKTDSVMRILGKPLEIREIGKSELPAEVLTKYPEATGGVWARTQFLLDTPEGKGAFIRLKENALREWSYGYDALDVDFSKVTNKAGDEVQARHLRTVKLYEYGPVLWGMCPATTTLNAKTDDKGSEEPVEELEIEPSEGKPAPEVTGKTIRVRVRNPKDFQQNSFRVINIGDKGNGIQATIGRLKGKTTTTTQAFIFSKEKWTLERAKAWVAKHKSDEIEIEEKTEPEIEKAPEGDVEDSESKEMVGDTPQQRLGDVLQGSIHRVFTLLCDNWLVDGYLDREQRIQLSSLIGDALDILSEGIPDEIADTPLRGWYKHGLTGVLLAAEQKAGRMLSAATGKRLASIVGSLVELLHDAGHDVPGFSKVSLEEDSDKSVKLETAPAEEQAAQADSGEQEQKDEAGPETQSVDAPTDTPPTFNSADLLRAIEIELAEIELMEVY